MKYKAWFQEVIIEFPPLDCTYKNIPQTTTLFSYCKRRQKTKSEKRLQELKRTQLPRVCNPCKPHNSPEGPLLLSPFYRKQKIQRLNKLPRYHTTSERQTQELDPGRQTASSVCALSHYIVPLFKCENKYNWLSPKSLSYDAEFWLCFIYF